MTTVFETEPCTRCGGTGRHSWNGEHSICYKCEGKNGCKALTKRGLAAYEYYLAKLVIPAAAVQVGHIIRTTTIRQLTVASIEVNETSVRVDGKPVTMYRFKNSSGLCVETNGEVRRLPRAEENEVLKAEALAYQATLTKQGKPRKR